MDVVNLNVLVVDDNSFNIVALETILKKFSLNPDSAFHGLEALEKIKENQSDDTCYHIVFLDCDMPVMDGFETADEIRKGMNEGTLKFIYIVGCTAYNSENAV